MKKREVLKKLTAAVLAIGVAASAIAYGGSQEESGNNAADIDVSEVSFPLEETATITFLTSAPVGTTQEPNERIIFQRLEEETNIHIDWTCYSSDEYDDKKALALTQSSSLPDGIFNAGMSTSDLLKYANQGVIMPVEELIDEYMPNLKKVLNDYPEYRESITAPDGHIYSFPWIEQLGAGKEAIQAIGSIPYINKAWLDYLGLDVPETTDELADALLAFKENAAELEQEFAIEGEVIPFSFIINDGDQDPGFLMGAFGYGDVPDHVLITEEGEVFWSATDDGFKEGIKYLNSLQEQGVIDAEAYTQEWATYVAKGKNGRYGLILTWDSGNIVAEQDSYVALPALTGPDGWKNAVRQNGSETSGLDIGRCVLTSSCSNPELAAMWLDLMYEPQQSFQNNWGSYGEEDSFNIFEMTEDGFLQHMDLGSESPVEVREAQSVNGPLAILDEYYDVYGTQPDDAAWRLDILHEVYVKDMVYDYVYPVVFMTQEDAEEMVVYETDLKTYTEQKKADWIVNGGIDEEWEDFQQKLEDYGLSKYLEIKQRYFDAYYE